MKVAWQFTAWGERKNRTVPLGNGMIGSEGTFCDLKRCTRKSTNSYRTLRDGSFLKRIPAPEAFGVGYFHLVPAGQNPRYLSTNSTPPSPPGLSGSASETIWLGRRYAESLPSAGPRLGEFLGLTVQILIRYRSALLGLQGGLGASPHQESN